MVSYNTQGYKVSNIVLYDPRADIEILFAMRNARSYRNSCKCTYMYVYIDSKVSSCTKAKKNKTTKTNYITSQCSLRTLVVTTMA
jgi:hypothetical protein